MTDKNQSLLRVGAIFLLFLCAQFVGFAVALVLASLSAAGAKGDFSSDILLRQPHWMGIGLLVGFLLLVLTLWATQLIRRRVVACEGFTMPRKWGIAVMAFMLFSFGVNLILTPLGLDDGGMEQLIEGMRGNALCLFTIAVAGPITEELVFREGIQRQLRRGGFSRATAIVAAALLFGAAHGNWAQGLAAVALGCLLGLLYEHSGDIRLSAPAHIINNSFALLLACFPACEAALRQLPAALVAGLGIALTALGGGLLWGWWRKGTR